MLRRTWEEARRIILSGELRIDPVLDKNGKQRYTPKTNIPMTAPNLPKAKTHKFFFRGTGTDATNKISILGKQMLRQDYWIKGTYLVELLDNTPEIFSSNTKKTKKQREEMLELLAREE